MGDYIPHKIRSLMSEVFYEEAHATWLDHPQLRFEGKTAREMIIAGRTDEVEALLNGLADGVFS